MRLLPTLLLAVACAAGLVAAADAPPFDDPMASAAVPSAQAASAPMTAVTRAGARYVAVGVRGIVLGADRAAGPWRQAPVPVSSDLVAVHFVDALQGWASGHDGVILHTADGGRHWDKQLDGHALQALLTRTYTERAAAGDALARHLLDEIGHDFENDTQQPLLGVWFADASNGFAVGSFGIIVATHDGGRTWEAWMDRVDNPELLHLFSIGAAAGSVYITAEKGTVFKLDAARQRFAALKTGYAGSLFGMVADRDGLVVYGLRGNAFRSTDGGAAWRKLETGVVTGLNGAAAAGDGRILLASEGGQLLASDDQGTSFHALSGLAAAPFSSVAAADDVAVVAGLNGLQSVALPR